MRKVVDIESTPNPNALKFNLDGVIAEETRSYLRVEQAIGVDPLAEGIFALGGVTGVMFCGDFVTVNKEAGVKWPTLRKKIVQLIEEAGAG